MFYRDLIREIKLDNPDAEFFDCLVDCAIIGVMRGSKPDENATSKVPSPAVPIYSKKKMLRALLFTGFSREDAAEYFQKFLDFNAGIHTPIIFDDLKGS